MAREIRIEGTKRLKQQLEALDARTSRAILAQIVVAAAEPVRAVAAQKAPIGQTGRLAGEMTTELLESKTRRASAGVGPHQDAWYGRFQEYGTVHHAAQPFLRPAYDEQKRTVSRRMRDDLRAEIRKAVR